MNSKGNWAEAEPRDPAFRFEGVKGDLSPLAPMHDGVNGLVAARESFLKAFLKDAKSAADTKEAEAALSALMVSHVREL
jgi:hypothetical protein